MSGTPAARARIKLTYRKRAGLVTVSARRKIAAKAESLRPVRQPHSAGLDAVRDADAALLQDDRLSSDGQGDVQPGSSLATGGSHVSQHLISGP